MNIISEPFRRQVVRARERDAVVLDLIQRGTLTVDLATGTVVREGRVLAHQACPNGYLRVRIPELSEKLSSQRYRIHRCVALAASGMPPQGCEVHHLDHDRTNNSAPNLAYVTRSENIRSEVRAGRWHASGSTHLRSMTLEQIAEARSMYRSGSSKRQLAAHFGVSPITVSKWLIKDPLRPRHQGKAFDLIAPNGQRHAGENLCRFCADRGLPYSILQELTWSGRSTATRSGWRNANPRFQGGGRSPKSEDTDQQPNQQAA